MLCVARQARTAYRFGPAQNRRCVSGQELRSGWTNTQTAWLDAQWSALPFNSTISVVLPVNDAGYNSLGSTFNWGPASGAPATAAPIYTVVDNVKCLRFDGVDDIVASGGNALLGVQTITIVALYRNFSAADAVIIEGGTDYNFQTGSMVLQGSSTAATSSLRGNIGYSTRTWASNQTPWTCTATVMNKAAGLGSEILVYENGTQVTVFTVSTDSDNTNTFGNQICRVGRRSTGALPMNGVIAGVMMFTRQLSLFEIQQVTRLMLQHAGLQ